MTQTAHRHINTLEANAFIDGVYGLLNPQLGVTRGGKSFLKCLLRDATGEMPARMWSFDEAKMAEIGTAGFVWVAGQTQLYNDQMQLIVEQIRAVDVSESDLVNLLPSTNRDIDEMFGAVAALLRTLDHPAMRALAEEYLGDEAMMTDFKQAPAAVSMHHAWIGGLLEHTLQLMQLADGMLPLYPKLNRDFVLLGLFLHDMGKTIELTWTQGFDYTVDGNLIGHIVRGAIWLQVKAAVAAKRSGQRLPPDALRVLQHIVLSHHGDPAFGAAKVPSTPEAIFIAMLDNLDAKTTMALAHARPDQPIPGDARPFTDKIWALDTRLYRPDPLAADHPDAD